MRSTISGTQDNNSNNDKDDESDDESDVSIFDSVHIVFSTECNDYFDWQSVALYYSFQAMTKKMKNDYRISANGMTRLLACTGEEFKHYDKDRLNFMPTHLHQNFKKYGGEDDHYPAYNKPGAMLSFTHFHRKFDNDNDKSNTDIEKNSYEDPVYLPKEVSSPSSAMKAIKFGNASSSMDSVRYLIYLDADMVLMRMIDPAALLQDSKPHTTIAGYYGYLDGVDNNMADDFDISKDDQQYLKKVGGWMISSKEDMYRVSPKWLSMTRSVRLCDNTIHCGTDDESKLKVWQKTGDQYITKTNPRPWISEMYGYVFGSALAHQNHVTNDRLMAYPAYSLDFDPNIIHYGLPMHICVRYSMNNRVYSASVPGCSDGLKTVYKFDKHWVVNDIVLRCDGVHGQNGNETQSFPFYPTPPWSYLKDKLEGPSEMHGVKTILDTLEAINHGALEYKKKHCNKDESHNIDEKCVDRFNKCAEWASLGECEDKELRLFMSYSCPLSCMTCDQRYKFDEYNITENDSKGKRDTIGTRQTVVEVGSLLNSHHKSNSFGHNVISELPNVMEDLHVTLNHHHQIGTVFIIGTLALILLLFVFCGDQRPMFGRNAKNREGRKKASKSSKHLMIPKHVV